MEPHFSVALIARNEAHTLPRLVQSLDAFIKRGGEIVVLDTGSTDNTVQVAAQAGCVVESVGDRFTSLLERDQFESIHTCFARGGEGPFVQIGQPLFHFAQAREAAAQSARNDWVLMPDASDVLPGLDIDFLDAQIDTGAYSKLTHWRENTAGSSSILFKIARLYDRRLYHWEGRAHEGLYLNPHPPAHAQATLECTLAQLSLRHIKDLNKVRPYLGSLALELLEHPENPRWTHYLGRELYYFGWRHSAIALLEAHSAMQDGWRPERSESLCLAGACWEALEQRQAAEDCYTRAFELDQSRREPLLRLADLAQRQGNFKGSTEYAAQALDISHPDGYMEPDINYTYRPHALLYWNLFWLGRMAQAREHWEICLAAAPDNVRFQQDERLFGKPIRAGPESSG